MKDSIMKDIDEEVNKLEAKLNDKKLSEVTDMVCVERGDLKSYIKRKELESRVVACKESLSISQEIDNPIGIGVAIYAEIEAVQEHLKNIKESE